MARLKLEQKVFIVQRLACFESPAVIIKAVKEEYGITINAQQLQAYDPSKVNGQALSKSLRKLFEDTRKLFTEDISSIPIANKAVRLQTLQRMVNAAEERKNLPFAAQLLEQAAKEVGDAYTNRQKHEHTGKDGGPMETVSRVQQYTEAELDKRIAELQAKLNAKK